MRRRLLAAFSIVLATLAVLGWVDNLILLRNPTELDMRARLILAQLVPDWDADIGHIEVDFPSRVVVERLVLKEKATKQELVSAERVEAILSLSDWLWPREVVVKGLRANLRRSKDGKLNLELPASKGGGLQPKGDVALGLEDARVTFEDEDVGSRALVSCKQASVVVAPDGSVKGRGGVSIDALVGRESPFWSTGHDDLEPGTRRCEIVPYAAFEVERRADGRVMIPIEVGDAKVGDLLRSILPRYVQEVIWSELNPTGTVDARVTLRLFGTDMPVRPEVYVDAKGCTLNPKKFPYPIKDIKGRFEISPGIVSWEDVTAATAGKGRLKSRGSFFLGEASEHVTLFISIDAQDVPMDETLRAAMPPDVLAVYDQFGVVGECGPSKVLIFKGAYMEEPAISVLSQVTGKQSAAFADYPVRFTAEKGTFKLEQGGNVTVDAEGSFDLGGKGKVAARIVHGDLIHVKVDGESVPIGPSLLAKLDPEVVRMVEPLRPSGGKARFEIVVNKTDPASRPVPHVVVDLDGVGVEPEAFPYRMTTKGHVEVTPSWRERAPQEKPEVTVDLSLEANAPGVAAAVVSGTIVLDPRSPGEFAGGLDVRCARAELDETLRRALPPEGVQIFERLSPKGSVRNLRARVVSPRSFDVQGEGEALTAALDAFPYRASVERFDISRRGRAISLRSVEGRTRGEGRFSLEGEVELPEPRRGNARPADPVVQVAVRAEKVPIEAALLDALPDEARSALAKLEPGGGTVDASLRIGLAPLVPPDLTGTIALKGAHVGLSRLGEDLEGLAGSPVTSVEGTLRLDGERIHLDGLRARFRDVPVTIGGSVAMGLGAAGDSVAAPASATTLDLIAHVDSLRVDEATRKLARGKTLAALERYPIEGPCDLDLHIVRSGETTGVDVRVSPKGVTVVPKILPLLFEDVRGTFEVKGGEPLLVDLRARLKGALVEVKRGVSAAAGGEAFAPPGTAVFRIRARGLVPMELADDSAPQDFAKAVRSLDLAGTLDLAMDLAVPLEDDRARTRFLAEVRTSSLALTAGIRFEDVKGTLRVAGSVAKFEPIELDGALALEHASWKKQDIRDARVPIHMKDGKISFGTTTERLTATVYQGTLAGNLDYDFKTERYQGALTLGRPQKRDDASRPDEGLRPALLQAAADELSRLQDIEKGPSSRGPGEPIKGELYVTIPDLHGGGTLPDGKTPVGIHGEVYVVASNANLVRVPFLLGTLPLIIAKVGRGESSLDPTSFGSITAKLDLKPSHIAIDSVRLDSPTLTVSGKDGRLDWNGEIVLELVPFKTGSFFDDIFKQFDGIKVTGTIAKPHVDPLQVGRLRELLKALGIG